MDSDHLRVSSPRSSSPVMVPSVTVDGPNSQQTSAAPAESFLAATSRDAMAKRQWNEQEEQDARERRGEGIERYDRTPPLWAPLFIESGEARGREPH